MQDSGEDILAFGWGVIGMKNVFAGLTPSALFIEYVSFSGSMKEAKRIALEDLKFVFAVSGDASTPGMMKWNYQSRISETVTGTLLYKENLGRLTHVLFRKIPNYETNDKAPFRMTEKLSTIKPELVYMPDLKSMRDKQTKGGCFRRFAEISLVVTVVLTTAFMFAAGGNWGKSLTIGVATGVILGAVFAPLIPIFNSMITGQG
jgi:hypothetical protein